MIFPSNERDARLLLSLCSPLGPVRIGRLTAHFGSAVAALSASPDAWAPLEGFGESGRAWRRQVEAVVPELEREKEAIERAGARWLTALDEEYPDPFRLLRDAPPVLILWGALKPVDALGLAVVGSRQPTAYGRAAAERLSRELAQAGVTVVSGLARGIDGEAHRAALAAGGRTVGFLGSGLGRFYPSEHRALADRMAQGGAVVTEFSMRAAPEPDHFPRRNRLIAAMSLGVLVVEARERSGALITAGMAADLGRDVFAVPGSIFSPLSRGPHRLIQQGAKPVASAVDMLEDMAVYRDALAAASRPAPRPDSRTGLSAAARRVLDVLTLEPVGVDALAGRAGLLPAELGPALLALELGGLLRTLPGKQFVRSESTLAISS